MTYRTLILNTIKSWFKDFYDKIIKNKRYYVFIGVGIPPKNFKSTFEKVISEDKINVMFTFELTIIRFKSSKNLNQLNEVFYNNFNLDTYFLTQDNNNLKHYASPEFFEYLRMPHQKYSLIHAQNTIDEINYAIDQAKTMTEEELQNTFNDNEVNDSELNGNNQQEKTINDILDKVNNEGFNSLTKEEKEKLDNYRNNQ